MERDSIWTVNIPKLGLPNDWFSFKLYKLYRRCTHAKYHVIKDDWREDWNDLIDWYHRVPTAHWCILYLLQQSYWMAPEWYLCLAIYLLFCSSIQFLSFPFSFPCYPISTYHKRNLLRLLNYLIITDQWMSNGNSSCNRYDQLRIPCKPPSNPLVEFEFTSAIENQMCPNSEGYLKGNISSGLLHLLILRKD